MILWYIFYREVKDRARLLAELGYFTEASDDKRKNAIVKYKSLQSSFFKIADHLSVFLKKHNPLALHVAKEYYTDGDSSDILLTKILQVSN